MQYNSKSKSHSSPADENQSRCMYVRMWPLISLWHLPTRTEKSVYGNRRTRSTVSPYRGYNVGQQTFPFERLQEHNKMDEIVHLVDPGKPPEKS